MASINVENDELIPVGTLLRRKLGRRIPPATQNRWRLHGVAGAKLECVRCGCWMTTEAAFAEFVRAQTANCTPAPMHDDAPTERSAATTKKLAAAGLL